MSELQRPLVSVAFPAFNDEGYVEGALNSVAGEGYARLELESRPDLIAVFAADGGIHADHIERLIEVVTRA